MFGAIKKKYPSSETLDRLLLLNATQQNAFVLHSRRARLSLRRFFCVVIHFSSGTTSTVLRESFIAAPAFPLECMKVLP